MKKFKSEKEKIEYYKKLKIQENNIAQKNMDMITEAYHEIEFGVIPEIIDNRSLAEKISDERAQQQQVQRNTLMLMSNDGEEAIRLQNLIGTATYQSFNRYFLDIYNALKNQIGRIKAQEAYEFIYRYISKANYTQGVDIPNTAVLEDLITQLQSESYRNDSRVNDILLKLDALNQVIETVTKNGIKITSDKIPSGSSLNDILKAMQEGKNSEVIVEELTDELGVIEEGSLDDIFEEVDKIFTPQKTLGYNNPAEPDDANLKPTGDEPNDANLKPADDEPEEKDNFPLDIYEVPTDIVPTNIYDTYSFNLRENTKTIPDDRDKIRKYMTIVDEMIDTFPDINEVVENEELVSTKMGEQFISDLKFLLAVIDANKTGGKTYGALKKVFNENRTDIVNFANHLKILGNNGNPLDVLSDDEKTAIANVDIHLAKKTTIDAKKKSATKLVEDIEYILRGVKTGILTFANEKEPNANIEVIMPDRTISIMNPAEILDKDLIDGVNYENIMKLINSTNLKNNKTRSAKLPVLSTHHKRFVLVSDIVKNTKESNKMGAEYYHILFDKLTSVPYSTAYNYAIQKLSRFEQDRISKNKLERQLERQREEAEAAAKAVAGGEPESKTGSMTGSGLKRFNQIRKRRIY